MVSPAPSCRRRAWADEDHNGCDTRNDILRRDLTDTTLKPGTQPGELMVRKGQGIPRVGESGRGDHVIQFKVEIPKKWTSKQEELLRQLATGPARRLVGLRPEGRAPAREGTEIQDADGRPVGKVTSGGFGPSVGGPVAMGYVEMALAEPGTRLTLMVRGKPLSATVAALPFVPRRYHR